MKYKLDQVGITADDISKIFWQREINGKELSELTGQNHFAEHIYTMSYPFISSRLGVSVIVYTLNRVMRGANTISPGLRFVLIVLENRKKRKLIRKMV